MRQRRARANSSLTRVGAAALALVSALACDAGNGGSQGPAVPLVLDKGGCPPNSHDVGGTDCECDPGWTYAADAKACVLAGCAGAKCPDADDTADCTGASCGPAPDMTCHTGACGGACGGCGDGERCLAGQCTKAPCAPNCPEAAAVLVPQGESFMGCNDALDKECSGDEWPYHKVRLDAFAVDQTEVTQGAYQQCLAAGGCNEPPSCDFLPSARGVHPVTCVSWAQAATYCAWAGERLCTEAEWEKAARGGCELYTDCKAESPPFPWGSTPPNCSLASMCTTDACTLVSDASEEGCGEGGTTPVGSIPAGASPYGALDMAGNVWEWVADWYGIDAYEACAGTCDNPKGPTKPLTKFGIEPVRVARGGSMGNNSVSLRVSGRADIYMDTMHVRYLGFRCCVSR